MPNITSVLTDLAGSALASKLGSKDKDHSKNGSSGSGLSSGINFGSALSHISSAISGGGKAKGGGGYSDPSTPIPNNSSSYNSLPSADHQMSGGYPYGSGGGGGGGYPPNQGGGYPGSNPAANQSGYGNPYPGYPPSQPGMAQPGAPYPGGGGSYGGSDSHLPGQGIGFGVPAGGQPYPQPGMGGGYPPSSQAPYPGGMGGGGGYQPNLGGGSGGGGYGGYQQPPSGPGYPGAVGGVYPTQAVDSVQQQYYGGGPNVGGAPPSSQYPQHQQQHQHHQQPPYSSGPPGGGGGYSGPPSAAMFSQSTPSIKPSPTFNANHSAEMLRKAMKGLGCNKDKVIQALCTCTNWQRQEVSRTFKTMYGKDLISELKGELSGDFEDLVLALMEPPARYDAYQLHKAMAGLGTKESVLIEIMTTRTNAQIQELKYTYKQLYHTDLERDLIGETSGHFKRLLVSLCCGGRDESFNVDPLRANQDARKLYRAGEQRLGTDESQFNAILAAQNVAQLRLVFQEYQTVSGHSIEQAINSEFSGDIRDGLLAIVKSIRGRPQFFAELIHKSMVGLGTRDTDLIRLVVTRSEIDLGDIRNVYPQLFNQSLEKAIAGDCSGAYKEGLIAVVRGNA